MKTKAWGVVVMVAMAWMLWSETETPETETETETETSKYKRWVLEGAYDTKKECVAGIQAWVKAYPRPPNPNKWEEFKPPLYPPTKRVLLGGKQTIRRNLYCLPSETDPRPRK